MSDPEQRMEMAASDQRADLAAAHAPAVVTAAGMRPHACPDPLYGQVRLAGWAAALLTTPPFARLSGISLSDVPGEWLFGRPFPTRLDHTRGVYHLTRLSRPRDRALQAAALAHDLGHGPFGHLTEPLMREWLGYDHEQRSARKLQEVRAALTPGALRHLRWLDWDEVAALILGGGADARGALLNGRLDYDNLDNVGRFVLASGLGQPDYDPIALARALRLVPLESPPSTDTTSARHEPTFVLAAAERDALAWQDARGLLYGYLHVDHANIVPHAMLRKAVELAFSEGALARDFLDFTDEAALAALERHTLRGVASLAGQVRAGPTDRYRCVLESDVPVAQAARAELASWRQRLRLEADLAGESGLLPHEVIVEVVVSSAARALPPFSSSGRPGTFAHAPAPLPAPRVLHLLLAPSAPRDYVRRLRAAGERRLAALGLVSRRGADAM